MKELDAVICFESAKDSESELPSESIIEGEEEREKSMKCELCVGKRRLEFSNGDRPSVGVPKRLESSSILVLCTSGVVFVAFAVALLVLVPLVLLPLAIRFEASKDTRLYFVHFSAFGSFWMRFMMVGFPYPKKSGPEPVLVAIFPLCMDRDKENTVTSTADKSYWPSQ